MENERKLLPVGPMARRLRVPVAWLREGADAARIPCIRAGRAYLFDPLTVESVLLNRARQIERGADHAD